MHAEVFEIHERAIALLIGVCVIAYFAYRQLDLPVEPSEAGKLPWLSKHAPSTVAGRSLFFEAYCYYVAALIGFYLVLCFSESFFRFVFGHSPSDGNENSTFNPNATMWPLTVALLIVGLSPEFPILRQVERFFRRLSRLSAGIPGNIRACIDELNKLPIESFADPNETVKEFKQRAKIYALILCSKGETIAKAEGEARILVRFQMLCHWTIAPESQIPWSEEALSKVQLLLPELKDRCDEWRNRLNQAVGELAKRPLPDSLQGLDLEALNLTEETAASVRHVWGNLPEDDVAIAKDYALASEKLTRFTEDIGIVFCLLLSHDQNIKSDNDKQFNKLSDHLATFNLQTIRNFIAWALFVVLLALFIIVLPYDLFREITRPNNPNVEPVENVDRIRSSIRIAAQFALGGFVSYGGALLGGAFYRRISVANNRFSYQQASAFVPIGAYIGIFVSAWVAATLANYLLFMAYWLPTSETPELLLGDFMEFSSRQAPLYSLSNAIFATYFMLCLQRFNSSGDAAISEMRRSRLLLEVIGLAVTSAILMGSAQILINIDVGDELFPFYAPSSKVLETSLAFAVPFLALLVVVHLMRRASTAREETSA